MKFLFDIDGPVMRFLGRLTDWIKLSVLWVICSIPLVTIVTSTSALYYVTLKMVTNTERGATKDFFRAFKDNLKQGLITTCFVLPIAAILAIDIYLTSQIDSSLGRAMFALSLGVTGCCFGVLLYVFPLQAKFSNPLRVTLKNACILAIQYFPNTILVLMLNCVPFVIAMLRFDWFLRLLPIWLLLAPGLIAFLCSKRYHKIFERLMRKTVES